MEFRNLTPDQKSILQAEIVDTKGAFHPVRAQFILDFLTTKEAPADGTKVNTEAPEGATIKPVHNRRIAQAYWEGKALFTKPIQAAKIKNVGGAYVGEWKEEGLYLFNTTKPLGKDTLVAAQALGIPVVNIKPEDKAEDKAEGTTEGSTVPKVTTKRTRTATTKTVK